MIAAPQQDGRIAPVHTSRFTVTLAVAAGMLAAFQVGKVHIALASIRHSFSLNLVSASWVLSALSIVSLLAAVPVGTLAARRGNKTTIVLGLGFVAVASAAGGFAPSLAWLLLSRLLEGVGFVMVVVAAPSLIVEVTAPGSLRLALACWSAYLPGGVALVTLLAPLVLVHHTWRAVWWGNAVLVAMAATLVALAAKGPAAATLPVSHLAPMEELRCVISARGPLLLAIIFGLYTMQHLSVMGFMPTLLHDRFHLGESRIGGLTATAMAANILGNLAAGVLLQKGFSRARMIAWTALFMALMTVGMFALLLPLPAFYLCAFAFSCVGGLIPSAVIGAAPFHTPGPSLLGATNGLLVQGSNLGLVVGPPLMSLLATRMGWPWVPLLTGVAALGTAWLAMNLRMTSHSQPAFAAAPLDL